MQLIDLEERSDIWTIVVTSAGARGFATDQVTFDLLDGVRGQRPQVWEQTSDGGNVPRSCELAESPATTVPLYARQQKHDKFSSSASRFFLGKWTLDLFSGRLKISKNTLA